MIALALCSLCLFPAEGPVATPKGAEAAAAPKAGDGDVDDSVVPKEQAEAFKPFERTWRCDGKKNTELAPDVSTRVTIAFRNDLGRWLSVKIDEQKSKENPHATSSQEIWGYSKELGGFVRNGADNQGGFYRGSSDGWVGDRFWWTTDSVKDGKKVKLKDTLQKQTDAKGNVTGLAFERAIDPSGTGDSFRVYYDGTCKR